MNEVTGDEEMGMEGQVHAGVEQEAAVAEETMQYERPPIPEKKEKKSRGGRASAFPWLMMLLMMLVCGIAFWHTRDYWMSYFLPAPWDAPYMITSAVYQGSDITEDGATFKANFAIDIDSKDVWKKVKLIPAKVAIIDAQLPPDAYLILSDGQYVMLTKKNGEIDVTLTYSVAVVEEAGGHKIMFERVPSVTCMFKATLPEEQLDVTVAGAQSTDVASTNGATEVSAALPDNVPIQLTWKKALPELPKGPPQFHSETKTLISVAEGVVLGETKIDFSILHNPTYMLELNVPQNVSILEVTGKDLRDWRLKEGKMTVHLEKETTGLYALNVKYEMSAGMLDGKMAVPMITGAGVEREKGEIGIVALSNIELKNGDATKAHQIDVKDLPSDLVGMTSQPVLLAYRYAEPGFTVTLDVNKPSDVDMLLSIIDRAHFTVMQTRDGKRITRAVYNVRNNRNQFLRIEMPAGAELWSASVAGKVSQPVKDESGRILLPLVRSQGQSVNAAFPVEIVYAEEGTKPDERGRGTTRVELPVCAEPIMNLMLTLYVPEMGRYDDFDGTLHRVEQFSASNQPVHLNPAVKAAINNQERQAVMPNMAPEVAARAELDVQLPLSGKVFLMEKILVIQDKQWFSYEYRNLGT